MPPLLDIFLGDRVIALAQLEDEHVFGGDIVARIRPIHDGEGIESRVDSRRRGYDAALQNPKSSRNWLQVRCQKNN